MVSCFEYGDEETAVVLPRTNYANEHGVCIQDIRKKFDAVLDNADIEAAIKIHLEDVRPFVAGADLTRDKNDVLYNARIQSVVIETLSTTNFFNDLTLSVNGVAVVNSTFSGGNIPYLRNLTFS